MSRVSIDLARARDEFRAQDELVFVPDAIGAERLGLLRAQAARLAPEAIRMHVPLVRSGGTVGGRRLRRRAPAIAALYRELVEVASALAARPLYLKEEDDDHAVVLYSYVAGDFMAEHFDRCGNTPGGSYSVTVGIVDESSSRLACRLGGGRRIDLATRPGSLTVYNGSRIAHAVTRLRDGERRIVMSGSYRTVPRAERLPGLAQRLGEGFLYFGWPGRERRR